MSATEIIRAIEALPAMERAEIFRYLVGRPERQLPITPRNGSGAWDAANIMERQRRICGQAVLPNVVLEARKLERY